MHSSDELELIVRQSLEEGKFSETDREVLQGVFVFQKKKARDVMRPRTKVATLWIGASEEEVWETLRAEGYSRYPVYDESPDDVVGVFLAKDLWMHDRAVPFELKPHVREALFVPEGRPAELVLNELRKTRAHMAVVLDEHGGMQGVLTLEDLVEELIGDIADEYDAAERMATTSDGVLELQGSLSLIDVRQDHHVEIPDGSWTTLGGYVFTRLGRVPRVGDRVAVPGRRAGGRGDGPEARGGGAGAAGAAAGAGGARREVMSGVLKVTAAVAIPRAEIAVRASRAGGAGGQHVNTSSTRIELVWSVRETHVLTEEERARVMAKLASRLDGDGRLRVVSSARRSQLQNREAAERRLAELVRRALAVPRRRVATRPSRGAVERRLASKHKRAEAKRRRSAPPED